MLHIVVRSEGQEPAFDHGAGPLEFGRGPARDVRRCFMTDPFVSRDHLRLEEDPSAVWPSRPQRKLER